MTEVPNLEDALSWTGDEPYAVILWNTENMDQPLSLTPAEEIYCNELTHPKRKHEFAKSRALFHKVSNPTFNLLRREGQAPIWPPGMNGSIAHRHGSVGLALTRDNLLCGADIEVIHPKIIETWSWHADEQEISLGRKVSEQANVPVEAVATLFFSFKESVFKALHPNFADLCTSIQDIDILSVDWIAHKLSARCRAVDENTTFSGSFVFNDSRTRVATICAFEKIL
ncbi:MAG: 4'-phosphopantetheinyl transferase superfamily protein [Oligoflexales bacterium]